MDVLSVIGLILAVTAILGGQYLEGGAAAALVNGPALLIVGEVVRLRERLNAMAATVPAP